MWGETADASNVQQTIWPRAATVAGMLCTCIWCHYQPAMLARLDCVRTQNWPHLPCSPQRGYGVRTRRSREISPCRCYHAWVTSGAFLTGVASRLLQSRTSTLDDLLPVQDHVMTNEVHVMICFNYVHSTYLLSWNKISSILVWYVLICLICFLKDLSLFLWCSLFTVGRMSIYLVSTLPSTLLLFFSIYYLPKL